MLNLSIGGEVLRQTDTDVPGETSMQRSMADTSSLRDSRDDLRASVKVGYDVLADIDAIDAAIRALEVRIYCLMICYLSYFCLGEGGWHGVFIGSRWPY